VIHALAAVVMLAGLSVGCTASSDTVRVGSGTSPSADPTATPIASDAASDVLPSEIQSTVRDDVASTGQASSAIWFRSTRSAAVTQMMNDGVQGDNPAYVVVVHGDFKLSSFEGPPGATAPTGHVLVYIFDAASMAQTDSSIGDYEPDLTGVTTYPLDVSS
jgi:hypothetical protein